MALDLLLFAQAAGQSSVEKFFGTLVSGLSLGAVYALLALGFVIIFKATQVVNFAHGAIAALGAWFVAYFAVVLNFPGRIMGDAPTWLTWMISAVLAILLTAVVGLLIERITIRPMIGQPLFSVAMITIGLEVIVRVNTNNLIDNQVQTIGDPWQTGFISIGDVRIFHTQIATVIVAALALVLLGIFFKSRVGIAMRATAFDQEAAMAQGIGVSRIFAIAWAIGAGLAAVGGIFSSVFPRFAGVSPFTPFIVFRAFPAVILGGLDSITGAVVGGFVIGIAEVMAGSYLIGDAPGWLPWDSWRFLGAGFSGIVPYIVMLIVLLVKPYGLFGTEEIRRV